MSKVAIVYWSGTGNTEAMANAVADGVQAKGSEADTLTGTVPTALRELALSSAERVTLMLPAEGIT